MNPSHAFSTILLLALLSAGSLPAEDRPSRPTTIPGMTAYHDLKYLPPERYSGDEKSLRGDYEMMLDLHVPTTGKGPFPVVFYVHGGSWSGGHKQGQGELAASLAKRGIAFCALNYVLIPKGIFPQVWWDFHNAARYLRANAQRYNIDPLRFGAYGLSAGGWVISSAAVPGGDLLATGMGPGAITAADLVSQGGRIKARSDSDNFAWLKPMRDPAPAWPGEAGGFSALAWDFAHHVSCGDPGSPSVQIWAGLGAKQKNHEAILQSGIRYTVTEMTNEKYVGKNLHLPPFFEPAGKRGGSETLDLDGKPGKLLGEVIGDFFVRELVSPNARPPSPEIWPVPRIVSGPTSVSMLAPKGATIHYTTDGSEPTATSPTYTAPFTVAPGTTVLAISVAPGMTPSGPARATFVAGTPAPTITGPESLPPGSTGKPYSVTFTASSPKARWQMQGDLFPNTPHRAKTVVYPNGMKLDPETGIWAGTPTTPGSYWIQIWVNEGPGTVAGYRNYRWTVNGEALAPSDRGGGEQADDPNVTLATLPDWTAADVTAVLEALAAKSLRAVSPNEAGDKDYLLLIHRDDKARAADILRAHAKGKAVSWDD